MTDLIPPHVLQAPQSPRDTGALQTHGMSRGEPPAPPPPLPPEARYLPFEAGPYRMAMGLVTIPEAAWFELDEHYPTEMAGRRALLATRHAEVFGALPASDAARRETLDAVTTHLARHHPAWFSRTGAVLTNHLTDETWDCDAPACDPLELAGRLVQEDLCLIQPGPEGPVFTAANLCFPSRWRLHEKLGRPLSRVHAAVPVYPDRLAAPVDRFMSHLKPNHIASRLNWSVLDDATLFQPTGKWRTAADSTVDPGNAGERLHLRVERQTLRRLPGSGAVLFGIRVHSYPLATAVADPATAARLAAAVRALPPDLARYKSLPPIRDALLAWLDTRAG